MAVGNNDPAFRDPPGYSPRGNDPADRRAIVHGSRSRYRRGCKCDQCRAAEAAYKRLVRARRR